MSGVSAPLSRALVDGVGECDRFEESSDGDSDLGGERSLTVDPRVAMIEGDEGGSGDRVK